MRELPSFSKCVFAVISSVWVTPRFVLGNTVHALKQIMPLLMGLGGDYLQFYPYTAINSLFYIKQVEEFKLYGRRGVSPTVGLGNFPLSRWFHLSLVSSYLYATMGVGIVLLSSLGWLMSHLLWLGQADFVLVCLVAFLAVSSGVFYTCTFCLFSYSSLGWLFVPFALYATFTVQPVLASFGWCLVAFGSPVIFIMGSFVTVILALTLGEPILIFSLFLGGVKVAFQLLPCIMDGEFRKSFVSLFSGIGAIGSKKAVRYPRRDVFKNNFWKMGIAKTAKYYIAIYMVTILVSGYSCGWPYALAAMGAPAVFVLNYYVRFSDVQHMFFFLLTVSMLMVLFSNSYMALIPFGFFCFAPLGGMIFDIPLSHGKPYLCSYRPVTDAVNAFLSPVQAGDTVFFAFSNPTYYDECFDRQRVFLEAPIYVSTHRRFRVLQSWNTVFDTNYEEAPSIWAETPGEMLAQCREWQSKWLVCTAAHSRQALEDLGFSFVEHFDWADLASHFNGRVPVADEGALPPRWTLYCLEEKFLAA
jgi:hypothetical protein